MKTYDQDAFSGTGAAGEDNTQDENSEKTEHIKFKKKLDTSFPLSGGEDADDLFDFDGDEEDIDEEAQEDDRDEEAEKKEFKRHIDTSFPLSGGETEDDL